MKQREKQIVWGIGGLFGLWIGWSMFQSWFIQPLVDLDMKIEGQAGLLAKAEAGVRKLQLEQGRLADARKISLPPNRAEARRLYLKWITSLTQSSGIYLTANPVPKQSSTEGSPIAFSSCPVDFEGIATYEQMLVFLRRFSEVNVLQRLSSFEVYPYTGGDPRMTVKFTAEGMSMSDAPQRATIFPEAVLAEPLTDKATTLTIEPATGFPEKAPFRIKLGNEWLDVTEAGKTQWTVTRAVDDSRAETHAKGATLELYPLRPAGKVEPTADALYQQLAQSNPFMKPVPPREFRPRLTPTGNQLVTKGQAYSTTVKAEGWNPAVGEAKFETEGDLPPGLTFDGKSGAIKWTPAKEVEAGEYKLRVIAMGAYDPRFRATADIVFKVREANRAPVFSNARVPAAYLGRPWTFDFTATDPDPSDKVKYSFSGTPPMGATIDSATGKVSWTPPEDGDAGDVNFTIMAADTGEPPMTVTRPVTVRTEEDAARFTKLAGVVTEDGVPEAWFFDPSINKTTKLKSGAIFKFADVTGTIAEIEKNGDYIIVTSGGQKMRLDSGKTLRDLKPMPETAEPFVPVPAPAGEKPAEEKPPIQPAPASKQT